MKRQNHQERHYRPDVDGLRAVAVTSVVLYHAGTRGFGGGYVGVDIFFVISGFLITGVICREIEAGKFTIIAFYERRIRRIFPALMFMLLAVSAVGYAALLPAGLEELGKTMVAATLFASNFVFFKDAGYFDTPSEFKPLLHTWSLAVEEQYYIFFPVFLWLIFRYFGKRWVLFTLPTALLSLGVSTWASKTHPSAAFFLLPSRTYELLLGALVSLGAFPQVKAPWLRNVMSLAGIAMLAWSIATFDSQTCFPGYIALIPCVGTAILVHTGADGQSPASRLLMTPPFVFIGLISYSLYLWHWPSIFLLRYSTIGSPSNVAILATVATAVTLATLCWRFIERPFRGRDAIFRRRGLFVAAGLTMLGFVSWGSVVWAKHGVPSRFKPNQSAIAQLAHENAVRCQRPANESSGASKLCVIGSTDAAASFLVWGDSHASAFAPAIDRAAKSGNKAGLLFFQLGCPPVLGIRKSEMNVRADVNEECTEQNDRTIEVIESRPEVTDVIVVARWQYYATGTGYGADSYHRVRLFARQGEQSIGVEQFETFAVNTLRRILKAGKRVYLVEPVPEFAFSIPEAMGRVILLGRNLAVLDLSLEQLKARNAMFTRLVQDMQNAPLFHVVKTNDIYCDLRVCRAHEGELPLYSDNNHIGERSNRLVLPRLESIFRDKVY